jgi:hypothetical protein
LDPESRNPSHNAIPTTSNYENTTAPSISPLPVPSTTQPPPAAQNLTQSIIAEEDPQRSIEISKDDEDDEATGDGLGEEDGDPDDDGEGDDDFNEGFEFYDKETGEKAKRSRRPLPPWLFEPFKD